MGEEPPMTVTVVFKNADGGKSHNGQAFQATNFEAHNAFGFLELQLTDGSELYINLADVFTFQVMK